MMLPRPQTAELLERLFHLALSTRLRQHAGINVDARCTAWGLLEGKFGGMNIRGQRWRTPLELTAERLMVRRWRVAAAGACVRVRVEGVGMERCAFTAGRRPCRQRALICHQRRLRPLAGAHTCCASVQVPAPPLPPAPIAGGHG